MILTVTLNTGLDHTLFLDQLRLGYTQKVRASTISMAGKPADASWVLSILGIPNLATGFAAGELGKKMEAMLRQRGAQTDFLWVAGETRLNTVLVVEGDSLQTTLTTETLQISPADINAFYEKQADLLQRADAMIVGGSAPRMVGPEVYHKLVAAAAERNVPVVLDASGPYLEHGLQGGPTVIKPNQQELEAFVDRSLPLAEDVLAAARGLRERYHVAVIATLGKEGAFAVLPGRDYFVPPLDVPLVSPAGAGDATVAGLAAALAKRQPLEEGVRLGLAAAAAVVMQPGTADCRKEDVERLYQEIKLVPL
jgi:1-phosphofructokinase family hexose kinase